MKIKFTDACKIVANAGYVILSKNELKEFANDWIDFDGTFEDFLKQWGI